MADEKETEWSYITGEEFAAHLEEAQKIVDAITLLKPHVFSSAIAAVAIIKNCVEITNGDMEWWIDFIRRGPEALQSFMLPENGVLTEGPKGRQ